MVVRLSGCVKNCSRVVYHAGRTAAVYSYGASRGSWLLRVCRALSRSAPFLWPALFCDHGFIL